MKIRISADSTADLSPELIEKYNIGITPLYIVKGEESFRDGETICREDIYAHVKAGGSICSTAAVTVADYEDFFSAQLKEYDAVVHFCISSKMSSCYQNACIVAGELGNVFPVDAYSLSSGIGLLVLSAAELAAEGKMSAEEIRAAVNAKREKLDVSFVLDTLDYLRKGGRCSALAALGANLLSLKPSIEVHDGAMGVAKKYRGTLEKSVLQYIRDHLEGRDDIDTGRIFMTDSGCFTEEQREKFEAEIRRCQPFQEILHGSAGCTIANHCGPGCIGILYYHK